MACTSSEDIIQMQKAASGKAMTLGHSTETAAMTTRITAPQSMIEASADPSSLWRVIAAPTLRPKRIIPAAV